MADEEKKKSFWETLPGIITALGGLFMGLAAVIAALNGGAKESVSTPAAPPIQPAPVTPQPDDVERQRAIAAEAKAKAEAAAAKVEAERAKAEAVAAKARAEELERKLAEVKARSEEAKSEPTPIAPSVPPSSEKRIGQYIDHGNGTITDTASGLMWKRCLEGLSGVNCEKGKTGKYTWDDAVKRFKDAKYAGYSDWRLPTIAELKTLVYCSKGVKNKDNCWCNDGSEEPTINQQAFPNTEASFVWSGSPYADYTNYAWFVNFSLGVSGSYNRSHSYAVRLVRSGQ